MKFKILHPVMMLGCILWFFAAGIGTAAADGPKLYISETHYSFGEVHEGEEVRRDFIIANKGAEPLKIIDVKTD